MAVAKSTCTSCHHIYPRNTMVQRTVSTPSGHSNGAGVSFSNLMGNGKKNPRYHVSRRQYHRNRKVWLCVECAAHVAKGEQQVAMFVGMLVLASLTLWFGFDVNPLQQFGHLIKLVFDIIIVILDLFDGAPVVVEPITPTPVSFDN